MSECVVRMEMPETCFGCDMFDDEDYGRCLIRYYNGEEDYIDYRVARKARMSWCPIVCALPENHGRLVDADAMAKDLNYDVELDDKALDDMNIVGYARERFQLDKDRKQDCIRYLSGQKTIIPAERKDNGETC